MDLAPYWSFNGQQLIDPALLAQQLQKRGEPFDTFWGKANSFCSVRGRHPSRGWILVTGQTLQTFRSTAHLPQHTLSIEDGIRRVTHSNLVVVRYEAIWSGVVDSKVTKDTVYLVELADCRHYGSWTAANKLYNYVDLDGSLHPKSKDNYAKIIQDHWDETIPGFFGRLTIRSPLPDRIPETIGFLAPGWDSLCGLVEKLGMVIAPAKGGGFEIFTPSDKIDAANRSVFDLARRSVLSDTEDELEVNPVPETIRVYALGRDYQYQVSEHTNAQDRWSTVPFKFINFLTKDLNRELAKATVPGTVMPIWAPISFRTGDDEKQIGKEEMEAHAKEFARLFVNGLVNRDTYRSDTFEGCWGFTPGAFFSGSAVYDVGEGMRTRVFTEPANLDPAEFTNWNRSPVGKPLAPSDETLIPPVATRHVVPWERIIHGRIHPINTGDGDATCRVRDPQETPTATDEKGWLQPGKACRLEVFHFTKDDELNKVAPHAGISVLAFNITGKPIPFFSECTARWHYQTGKGGAWQIFVGHEDPPNYQAACIPQSQLQPVSCITAPNLITVRKDGGLRLLFRKGRDKVKEAVIDLAGGPTGSVMAGRGVGNAPYWLSELSLAGSITLQKKKWLKWGEATPGGGSGESGATWLGPPTSGGIKMRLPSSEKAKPGAFLQSLSGNGATCIPTQWFGPGISVSVSFSAAGSSCSSQSCVTLTFKHGLLMSQKGLNQESPMQPSGSNSCNDTCIAPYAPCETIPAGPCRGPTESPSPSPSPPSPSPSPIPPVPGPGGPGGPGRPPGQPGPGGPGGPVPTPGPIPNPPQDPKEPGPNCETIWVGGEPFETCCPANNGQGLEWVRIYCSDPANHDSPVCVLLRAGNMEDLGRLCMCYTYDTGVLFPIQCSSKRTPKPKPQPPPPAPPRPPLNCKESISIGAGGQELRIWCCPANKNLGALTEYCSLVDNHNNPACKLMREGNLQRLGLFTVCEFFADGKRVNITVSERFD